MDKEVTVSKAEYEALVTKSFLDSGIKTVSLLIGIIGILTIFWKISIYVNEIKTDVKHLKEIIAGYTKRVSNINAFLIRKFDDYRHREEDED